jgi:hypothetical protein
MEVDRCLLFAKDGRGAGSLPSCLRAAANLVAEHPQLTVLVVASAQLISNPLPPRVDLVLLPMRAQGRRDGKPCALRLGTACETVRGLRVALLQTLPLTFRPQVLLVGADDADDEAREAVAFFAAQGIASAPLRQGWRGGAGKVGSRCTNGPCCVGARVKFRSLAAERKARRSSALSQGIHEPSS